MATPQPALRDPVSVIRARASGISERFAAGQWIYRRGDAAESIFLLESGTAKIVRPCQSKGREIAVLCRIVSPGNLFGLRSAFGQDRREFAALAVGEVCTLRFGRDEFRRLCHWEPELWDWLAAGLVQRVSCLQQRLEWAGRLPVEQRILLTLAQLGEQCGGGSAAAADLPLTQSEVAAMVGATRETTSTALNRLQRRGLVRLGRRMVTVPPGDVLRQAAQA